MKNIELNFNKNKYISHTSNIWFVLESILLFVSIGLSLYFELNLFLSLLVLIGFALIPYVFYLISYNHKKQTVIFVKKEKDHIVMGYYRKNDPENECGNNIETYHLKNINNFLYEKNKLYLYGDIVLHESKNGKIKEIKMNRIGIYNYFDFTDNFFDALNLK